MLDTGAAATTLTPRVVEKVGYARRGRIPRARRDNAELLHSPCSRSGTRTSRAGRHEWRRSQDPGRGLRGDHRPDLNGAERLPQRIRSQMRGPVTPSSDGTRKGNRHHENHCCAYKANIVELFQDLGSCASSICAIHRLSVLKNSNCCSVSLYVTCSPCGCGSPIRALTVEQISTRARRPSIEERMDQLSSGPTTPGEKRRVVMA